MTIPIHLKIIRHFFMSIIRLYNNHHLSTHHLCILHFLTLSIYIQKKHLEAREYNWKMTRKVCPACVHNGTQIAELFESTKGNSSILSDSQHHLHCTHLICIPNRQMDFRFSDSCTRKPLHILDSTTCACTSEKWNFPEVWHPHPSIHNKKDRITCKIPQRKAYESSIFLNFYVSHTRTYNCIPFSKTHE